VSQHCVRLPDPDLSVPARRWLKQRARVWDQTLGSGSWAARLVRRGLHLPLRSRPTPIRCRREVSAPDQRDALQQAVSEMLRVGAIRETRPRRDSVESLLFCVPKAGGGWRPCLDLRPLNEHVEAPRFSLEGLRALKAMTLPGDFAVTLDLKNAYWHVPLARSHTKWFHFRFGGTVYQCDVLPFGVAAAPWVFHTLLAPIVRLLRAKGIRLTAYLDDILVLGRSAEECAMHGQTLVDLLTDLGFRFSTEKCAPVPSQKFRFLGWDIDTVEFMISLPSTKRERIMRECRRIRNWATKGVPLSIRAISRLIGQLCASADAVKLQRLKTHALERCKARALRSSGAKWDTPCALSPEAILELRWWEREVAAIVGRPIRPPPVDVVLRTDASALGWGAAVVESRLPMLRQVQLWGRLPQQLRESISNETELYAIHRALQAMAARTPLRGLHIRVQSDNTTAVFYVNRGAGRALRMTTAAAQLWKQVSEWGVTLSAEFLPGVENTEADALSRQPLTSDDWVLRWSAFQLLQRQFGKMSVDAFAEDHNTRLRRFASAVPHHKSVETSGLLLDFTQERAYCFPPPRLLPQLLATLVKQRASAVVVVPYYPGAAWWPLWLKGTRERVQLGEAVVPYYRRPKYFVAPRMMAGIFYGGLLDISPWDRCTWRHCPGREGNARGMNGQRP
jgi:hypothetical protein